MLTWITGKALTALFGDGFAAEVAGRGTAYLAAEAGKAIRRDDERVTRVRLRPGETYTVVARPPQTRHERKLAAKQASLLSSYQSLTRPSRTQLRSAKKLSRAQRRLDRAKVDSRRYHKRLAAEEKLGLEFDCRMRPSRREVKVAGQLDAVTRELDALRDAQMARLTTRRRRRRRERVTIYS